MHVATRATTATAPITMPAMAPLDRGVLFEVEVGAEVEADVKAEAGAELDVVVEEVELGAADGDDVARAVAGYSVCE